MLPRASWDDEFSRLGVLPCEVVNAVGGGLAVQGGVGSVVVVVVEPGLVGGLALGLAGVGVGVGPLEGQSVRLKRSTLPLVWGR